MKKYDILCLFDPKTDETKVDAILNKLTGKISAAGGKVEKTEKKGLRKLPYRFQKRKDLKEANFVNLVIEAPANVPAEATHLLRITEEVVRAMITERDESLLAAPAEAQPKEEKVEIAEAVLMEGQPASGQS